MSEIERLANECLDRLCNKYPESENYPSRGIMQASFEIFRNEIVFLDYCEESEKRIKINIINGMRLLNYG
jgi:hypothetical protein